MTPAYLCNSLRMPTLALALAIAAAAQGAMAQQPAAGGGDPVVVDFLAISNDGQPITDIKADQVTLRIDGRPPVIRRRRRSERTTRPTPAGPCSLRSRTPRFEPAPSAS
jgi:hypothetical protein